MVENKEEPLFSHEYMHHVLYPGVHYGKHSRFGNHVALGDGANSVHLYGSKIYIGGKDGTEVPLTPAQMLIVSRVLGRLEQRINSKTLIDNIKAGETKP